MRLKTSQLEHFRKECVETASLRPSFGTPREWLAFDIGTIGGAGLRLALLSGALDLLLRSTSTGVSKSYGHRSARFARMLFRTVPFRLRIIKRQSVLRVTCRTNHLTPRHIGTGAAGAE